MYLQVGRFGGKMRSYMESMVHDNHILTMLRHVKMPFSMVINMISDHVHCHNLCILLDRGI